MLKHSILAIIGAISLLLIATARLQASDSTCAIVEDTKAGLKDFSTLFHRIGSTTLQGYGTALAEGFVTVGVDYAIMSSGIDEAGQNRMIRWRSAADSSLFSTPNYFGTTGVGVLVVVGTYATGWIGGVPVLRKAARNAAETMLIAGVITTVSKGIIGRARPDAGEGARSFDPFSFNEAHFSMPSGHTTVAFSIASAFARVIDNTYATIGLYGLATGTAMARMYFNKHWFSDVLSGAGIAIASSSLVQSLQDDGERSGSSTGWIYTPTMNGLAVSYCW